MTPEELEAEAERLTAEAAAMRQAAEEGKSRVHREIADDVVPELSKIAREYTQKLDDLMKEGVSKFRDLVEQHPDSASEIMERYYDNESRNVGIADGRLKLTWYHYYGDAHDLADLAYLAWYTSSETADC